MAPGLALHPSTRRVRAVFVSDSERELKSLKKSLKIYYRHFSKPFVLKHLMSGGEGRNRPAIGRRPTIKCLILRASQAY